MPRVAKWSVTVPAPFSEHIPRAAHLRHPACARRGDPCTGAIRARRASRAFAPKRSILARGESSEVPWTAADPSARHSFFSRPLSKISVEFSTKRKIA
eukprot:scaffold7339_cov124-Isochrysis_galbana.AAC.1